MKQTISIRQIANTEYDKVHELIKTAFKTAEHSDGDEQNFAANLRAGETYIPELDLIAELDGALIGHILFTKIVVEKSDGGQYDALMAAPLSVLLEHRSAGVGSALMNEGLRIAAKLGYEAVFLLGEPDYYQRFGYKPTHPYGIGHDQYPAEYLLVRELTPGALEGIDGKVIM